MQRMFGLLRQTVRRELAAITTQLSRPVNFSRKSAKSIFRARLLHLDKSPSGLLPIGYGEMKSSENTNQKI